MKPIRSVLLIAWLLFAITSYAQTSQLVPDQSIPFLPAKYLDNISDKASALENQMDKNSAKALAKMQKQEERIRRKLFKIDSAKASGLFSGSQQQYARLTGKLENGGSLSHYSSSIDTLTTSLKFLKQNPELLANIKQAKEKLGTTMQKVKDMDAQFQKAEAIKKFLRERQAYLKQQLQQAGFAKELKKWNKQVYYFNQQLNDYKSLLKDHKRAEKKAMELLSKTKLFRDFLRKNSQLASLFRLPGDPADPTSPISFAGLQTRTQVNAIIQQQLLAGGPAAQQLTNEREGLRGPPFVWEQRWTSRSLSRSRLGVIARIRSCRRIGGTCTPRSSPGISRGLGSNHGEGRDSIMRVTVLKAPAIASTPTMHCEPGRFVRAEALMGTDIVLSPRTLTFWRGRYTPNPA